LAIPKNRARKQADTSKQTDTRRRALKIPGSGASVLPDAPLNKHGVREDA